MEVKHCANSKDSPRISANTEWYGKSRFHHIFFCTHVLERKLYGCNQTISSRLKLSRKKKRLLTHCRVSNYWSKSLEKIVWNVTSRFLQKYAEFRITDVWRNSRWPLSNLQFMRKTSTKKTLVKFFRFQNTTQAVSLGYNKMGYPSCSVDSQHYACLNGQWIWPIQGRTKNCSGKIE